jgi:biopolymer transport protein ExbB
MKRLYIIPALLLLSLSGFSVSCSRSNEEEVVEVSTVEALLALLKKEKLKSKLQIQKRSNFMANKNKQASILAAEKRELAETRKEADTLEAEYKKNEEDS